MKKKIKEIKEMASIFKLLSNDIRLCIMVGLCKMGETKVGDLQHCIGASQSVISQHLAKLKALNLVSSRKEGLEVYYKLTDSKICDIVKQLDVCNDKTCGQ
ncbi:MAG: metalloregulator ArsR/SmtB family transcription factor [Bacilli bacterium]|nr:metalloregulator ArsR/SmtB family transcription factor [Bacilli bacterium]